MRGVNSTLHFATRSSVEHAARCHSFVPRWGGAATPSAAIVAIAAGAFKTSRQLGGIIGVAVMGLVVGAGETTAAIRVCLLTAVAALVVGALISGLGLTGEKKQSDIWDDRDRIDRS